MMRLFEKLNSPIAVIMILAVVLAINGFIFYQQRSATPETSAPEQEETPAQPSETGPERNPEPDNASDKGSDERSEEQADESDADSREQRASDERDEENGEQTSREGSGEGQSSSPSENEPREESGDDAPQEESGEEPNEGSGEESDDAESREASQEEPGNNGSREEPRQESQGGSGGNGANGENGAREEPQDGSGGDEPQRGGSRGESGEAAEQEEIPLAGLGDTIEDCDGNRERCVRDFVSRVSPESRYIGGRTDLASNDSGQNAEVLYFEDPDMDACQFERGRHESEDGPDYTVILVGAGSFNDERGEECIPTT